MTAADRLRAAVEAALCDCEYRRTTSNRKHREWCNVRLRGPYVLAAVQPIVEELEARKDAAYLERNQVVAALARLFPSGIAQTAIKAWSEDWHGCVYIDLPTGQVSWHYHDSQAYLFDGLPPYTKPWDGHDTPEKYRRLAALRGDDRDAEIARLKSELQLVTSPHESVGAVLREHEQTISRLRRIVGYALARETNEAFAAVESAALRGDWPAVRAAGVVLPGEDC